MKKCNKCNENKSLELFNKSKSNRDGFMNYCKVCHSIQVKKSRSKYKEYDREYARSHWESKKNNPEYQLKHREYQKEYKRLKRLDPIFRLKENLRTYFYRTITLKSKSVFKYLGCTLDEFKTHIEVKFNHKMNWENYGDYWEVDHIRPIESFNFKDENEIIECWNYKNLQPLTKNKNRIKSNKYENTSRY